MIDAEERQEGLLDSGNLPADDAGEKPAEGTEETQQEEQEEKETKTEEEKEEQEKEEEEKEEEEDIFKPRKKTVQDRINQLTYLRRQAERERDYWKNLALQLMNQTQQEQALQAAPGFAPTPQPYILDQSMTPPPVAQPKFTKPRPKIDDFETQEAYEEALLQWWEEKRQFERQFSEQQSKLQQLVSEFMKKAEPLRQKYEDFDEVVNAPVFTPTMREVILQSENGPILGYYLGRPENRLEADRIASLPPAMQVYELGKLEAKLVSQMKKSEKKITKAPPPINPVSGTGGEPETDLDKLPVDEFIKRRRQQLYKRR